MFNQYHIFDVLSLFHSVWTFLHLSTCCRETLIAWYNEMLRCVAKICFSEIHRSLLTPVPDWSSSRSMTPSTQSCWSGWCRKNTWCWGVEVRWNNDRGGSDDDEAADADDDSWLGRDTDNCITRHTRTTVSTSICSCLRRAFISAYWLFNPSQPSVILWLDFKCSVQ